MKTLSAHFLLRSAALLLVVARLGACALFVSWDQSSDSWVGQPIANFEKLNGPPSAVTQLNDQESEYQFDFPKLGPGCVHWWRVTGDGIILGYRYVGHCRVIG